MCVSVYTKTTACRPHKVPITSRIFVVDSWPIEPDFKAHYRYRCEYLTLVSMEIACMANGNS